MLRRKWTLRASGQQVVFIKKQGERAEHVIMKALLWALYLPPYPDLRVEVVIGGRYKPDVVALDPLGAPRFWGEAGQVGAEKLRRLLHRLPDTHLAIARWGVRLEPLAATVGTLLHERPRRAPVDLLALPTDSVACFITDDGTITITHADIEWYRL